MPTTVPTMLTMRCYGRYAHYALCGATAGGVGPTHRGRAHLGDEVVVLAEDRRSMQRIDGNHARRRAPEFVHVLGGRGRRHLGRRHLRQRQAQASDHVHGVGAAVANVGKGNPADDPFCAARSSELGPDRFVTGPFAHRGVSRVVPAALAPHHMPFGPAGTAHGSRVPNLVKALHALRRAARRRGRENALSGPILRVGV